MRTSESVTNIAKALVKAQSEMGSVVKDSKNPFFKSSYATLNAVREAVLPLLNKYGITVLQPMVSQDNKQFVETVLLHESGEFISGTTEVVVGKQNDPQAAGSGISYARRYSLLSVLCGSADDDDAEGAMSRTSSKSTSNVTSLPSAKATIASTPVSTPSTSSFRKPPRPAAKQETEETSDGVG